MELVHCEILLVLSITDCLWKLNQGTAPHAWPHPKKILQVRRPVIICTVYIFFFFLSFISHEAQLTCKSTAGLYRPQTFDGSLCSTMLLCRPIWMLLTGWMRSLAHDVWVNEGLWGADGARPLWLIERAKGTGMASNVSWENKQLIMALNGSLVIST